MSTYVIAFESTHAAMAASKTLASGSVDFQTIPVPTAISAGCGIAVRFDAPDPEEVLARIFGAKRDTGLASLYRATGDKTYERVCAL
ncbi:DUF3343 domain-containing protein [Adlercreutzia sp. ZJ473]|uniref:DUF3343 domain-containing protein n=1 Tax=Adlercreutzia sp. ZJ473 TaxID=2722822 RepID=UPI001552ED4B